MSMTPTTEEAKTKGQEEPVTILYTNYRGETAVRRIVPGLSDGRGVLLSQPFWFGESDWHKGADGKPEPQWFLRATDEPREIREHRDFALSGIKAWGQAAVDAALAAPRTDSAERTAGDDDDWAGTLARSILHREGYAHAHLVNAVAEELRRIDAVGYTKGHEAGDAHRKAATPAPSSPGVPDSLWALSEAAPAGRFEVFRGIHHYVVVAEATGQEGLLNLADANFAAASANFVRTLRSAHPAGQSDDGAERCIACDKPLKAGERVLPDAEGGKIHTACCGPEREGYTKGDGEPLGPNDPIPQGYIYEPERPAGQSTGQGAEPRRMAEGCCSAVSPCSHQQRDPYSLCAVCQKASGLADKIQAAAPDSTRTGQVEAKWVMVPAEPTQAMWAAFRSADAGSIAFTKAYHAMIAALPAAPEAQGAWRPELVGAGRLSTDRKGDVTINVPTALCWLQFRADAYTGKEEDTRPGVGFSLVAYPETHGEWPSGVIPRTEAARLYQMLGDFLGRNPAPPASSGQESASGALNYGAR